MNKKTTSEELDCRYCTEYFENVGCTALGCPYLKDRIECGMVGYEEIIANTFRFREKLYLRLQKLIGDFHGTMWLDEAHEQRFREVSCKNESKYSATLYLLTADEDMYYRSKKSFTPKGLDIEQVKIQGISPFNYSLFAYAKKLYAGETDFPLDELIDGWTIPDEAFRLIVNAIIIAMHGEKVLNITQITTKMEDEEDVSIQS